MILYHLRLSPLLTPLPAPKWINQLKQAAFQIAIKNINSKFTESGSLAGISCSSSVFFKVSLCCCPIPILTNKVTLNRVLRVSEKPVHLIPFHRLANGLD